MTSSAHAFAAAASALSPDFASLEELLTEPDGIGLGTASPLQRAICRAIEGQPLGELATLPEVLRAMGDVRALEGVQPSEVCIVSGIRTAKSMMAAARAIRMALTADVSSLKPIEVARVSIVSLKLDLARVVFGYVAGTCTSSERLRHRLVGEPTGDTVTLRHPSGRLVEIKVAAGAKAGASLVARWSAGVIFDEAPRMVGADEGVVNLDDARTAAIGRILPGAQLLYIGSPWAPFGPIWRMVHDHHGKPSSRLLVIRAPAPDMAPSYWTPERVQKVRAASPEAARTDVDAEFAEPVESMFTERDIEQCTRESPVEVPPLPGFTYEAAMDPATRSNAWTLVVRTGDQDGKRVIVAAREWVPGVEPLRPAAVLDDIAAILKPYRVSVVLTDQFSGDALNDLAMQRGLVLDVIPRTGPMNVQLYTRLQTRLRTGQYELPPLATLASDLKGVRKRVTQQGLSVELRRTPDGRHCDFAAALALLDFYEVASPVDAQPETEEERLERLNTEEEGDDLDTGFERIWRGALREDGWL